MTVEELDFLHPAHAIKLGMKQRGWDLQTLVVRMIDPQEFTRGEYGVMHLAMEMYFDVRTPDITMGDSIASGLSRAFGVDKGFFLRMHDEWRKLASAAEKSEQHEAEQPTC